MADDQTSLSPRTSRAGGPWRVPLLAGLLVLAVVVVVTFVVRSGDGDSDAADTATGDTVSTVSTATDSAATASSAPSTDASSASDSASLPAVPSIAPGVDLDGAVKQVIAAHFPGLVPSQVPSGWTLTGATFKARTWDLTFTTAGGGTAGVTQSAASAQDLVAQRVGADAAPTGTVNLKRFGTGAWDGYQGSTGFGMTHDFHGTTAVVYAGTQDDVVTLGQQLLTAEDGQSSGD